MHEPNPLLLVLDFDSTLTTTSTLPEFLSIPTTVFHCASPPNPTNAPPATADALAAAYVADLEQYHATNPLSSQFHTHFSLATALSHHNSLRAIERASFLRGVEAFKAVRVTEEGIREAGKRAVGDGRVVVRRGVRGDGGKGFENGGRRAQVHVLSVAWSPAWIYGVLGGEMGVHVVCNDVLLGEAGEQGLYVAADKLRCLRGLVAAEKGGGGGKPWVIYVGDSVTDLECLLEADVGIVVRDEGALGSEQRELREVLGRAGVGTYWVGEFGEVQTGEERVLWWARDFEEVVASGCLVLEGKILGRSVW
ncbi:hypothetical protein G7Y79_00008g022920 [Physcia stellaris]|nr:hypothetical protein G7Y79_00008g022920 [Physcia stellaris]